MPPNRDLGDTELWARSLRRSVQRRELTALSRRHATRRKGATLAVSASMAVTPALQPLAALASSGTSATAPARSVIHLPSSALLSEGDTGAAVVAVQGEVGVDDDGIFGPITRAAVESFQQRYGLPVTGEVDARTWTALFHSNVSFVGGGGARVLTVYRPGAAAAEPATVATEHQTATTPAATPRTDSAPRHTSAVTPAATPRSVSAPPATPETVSAPARTPRTGHAPAPAATPRPVSAPAPVATTRPVSTAGGCGSGAISTPVSGPVTGRFGESRPGHLHAGEDISAPAGTPVRAAQCGTVSQAGRETGSGNIVCIQHAGGVSTCYAHLSQIGTTQGAYVHVGDVIGQVGCTGNCTGPHLHFEVRQNGKATDPEPYLRGSATIPAGSTSTVTATLASATAPKAKIATTSQAQTTAAAPGQPAVTSPAATTATAASAPAATA